MRITTPLNDQEQSPQESPRKMFVGGLSWLTTPENLRDYFQNYGEVLECMIMKDAFTKRSRGFGFITFQDSSSVDKVLSQEKHFLDEKQIDPKVAFPRQKHPRMVTKTRKAFVGGLSASTNEQQLREYFSKFGEVEEVTLMYDRTTLRHRGFGFVTFATEEACDDVVNIHYHQINERKVECKKAQPKELMWAHNYNKSKNALARSQLSDIIGSIPLSAGYPPITLLTRPISIGSYAFANCYEFPLVPFDHINQAIPSTGVAYIQAAPPPPAAIPASDRNPAVYEMLNQAAMTAAPNALELVPLDNALNSASFISRTNNSQNFYPGPVYNNGFH